MNTKLTIEAKMALIFDYNSERFHILFIFNICVGVYFCVGVIGMIDQVVCVRGEQFIGKPSLQDPYQ